MPKLIDITGKRYGKLLVERVHGCNKHGQWQWVCKCDCGNTSVATGHHLRQGNSESCGCETAVRRTHGLRQSRAYRIWSLMRDRCTNENSPSWESYGARGIQVCEQWRDFVGFFSDMGHPPTDQHTIDRIDNDGNYEPSNCRWATIEQQANNKRNNRIVSIQGVDMTLAQAARMYGKNYKTLHDRLSRGLSIEEAIGGV